MPNDPSLPNAAYDVGNAVNDDPFAFAFAEPGPNGESAVVPEALVSAGGIPAATMVGGAAVVGGATLPTLVAMASFYAFRGKRQRRSRAGLTRVCYRAIVLTQQYNSTLRQRRERTMNAPQRPHQSIVPAAPAGDRRPTVIRSAIRDRDQIFRGWGPSI